MSKAITRTSLGSWSYRDSPYVIVSQPERLEVEAPKHEQNKRGSYERLLREKDTGTRERQKVVDRHQQCPIPADLLVGGQIQRTVEEPEVVVRVSKTPDGVLNEGGEPGDGQQLNKEHVLAPEETMMSYIFNIKL